MLPSCATAQDSWVKCLMTKLLRATIIRGCAKGEDVFIPRILVIPNDLAFTFKRTQFPIKLSIAMSINKAQGQTLKVAGIDLQSPCFSHGLSYVACSRVDTANNLYILHFGPVGDIFVTARPTAMAATILIPKVLLDMFRK